MAIISGHLFPEKTNLKQPELDTAQIIRSGLVSSTKNIFNKIRKLFPRFVLPPEWYPS